MAKEGAAPARSTVVRRALRVMLIAATPIALAMPLLSWIERSFLFHPRAAPTDLRWAERTPDLERWWIDTAEGRVEAFFVPGAGVSAERPGPLLIYAHGNAEVIDPLPAWLQPYRVMGISVLMPEYRGYGRSAGSPSESAIRDDLIAFHDRAVARPEVDRARVVLHGVSLGGGAISLLARARPPSAVVLQSTFTSVADLAWEMFRAPRFLVSERFDSIDAHRAARRPTLILHGTRDDLIPVEHARRMHAAIPGSELVTCDAGHNDLPPERFDYWGTLERFLRRAAIIP